MRLAAAIFAVCCSTIAASAGSLPDCDADAVLSTLTGRQAWAEAQTWKDGVTIAGIQAIRERRTEVGAVSAIDRRICSAKADLVGARRPVSLYYVVSAGEGFAGYGWNVEFCLSGRDPYRVYGADCKILK